ncbi:hypothetical protein TNCV_351631 [Trichonephila clavipes]|nr:hypothetical protein TNCV_351631 [Trichonephila clavipes]
MLSNYEELYQGLKSSGSHINQHKPRCGQEQLGSHCNSNKESKLVKPVRCRGARICPLRSLARILSSRLLLVMGGRRSPKLQRQFVHLPCLQETDLKGISGVPQVNGLYGG